LAGTWTATGWPATLESAVLSGHEAAAGALRALGLQAPGEGRALDGQATLTPTGGGAGSAVAGTDGASGAGGTPVGVT
jgi:hypothetical protein